jgi:hypothetical protein
MVESCSNTQAGARCPATHSINSFSPIDKQERRSIPAHRTGPLPHAAISARAVGLFICYLKPTPPSRYSRPGSIRGPSCKKSSSAVSPKLPVSRGNAQRSSSQQICWQHIWCITVQPEPLSAPAQVKQVVSARGRQRRNEKRNKDTPTTFLSR